MSGNRTHVSTQAPCAAHELDDFKRAMLFGDGRDYGTSVKNLLEVYIPTHAGTVAM